VSRLRITLVLLFALAVVGPVGLVVPAADARAKAIPKVGGIAPAGQDWYNAKLKARWKPVKGATYQVRWSYKTAGLARAKIYTSRAASAYSPTLSNRCIGWYVQVRAIKSHKAGKWSSARRLGFKNGLPNPPVLNATTQTSSSQAQVRWNYTPYVGKYRLHWSRKPFGGVGDTYTPWYSQTARSAVVGIRPVGVGDQFLNVAYGNATYGQLQYFNGCTKNVRQTTFFAMLPKPIDPGDGTDVRFGSYNVENLASSQTTKIGYLADNISGANLDVMVLQEATAGPAGDLATALARRGESDWELAPSGGASQQILYRKSAYTIADPAADAGTFGSRAPSTPSTPNLTPWARLTPTTGDPKDQPIFVTAVHLAEGAPGTSAIQNKRYTHAAADYLLGQILAENKVTLPEISSGDFKGNFDDYCTESSKAPTCPPQGQPTFIRAGYYDASAALKRIGAQYATVNKHDTTQPSFAPLPGPRADFILLRYFKGASAYVNLANKVYGGVTPTDHNLVYADLQIPRLP
jgi:hypothetical protein